MAKRKTSERNVNARDDNGNAICGAKTRSGGKCKTSPMPNGRCRMHGGNNPGPPLGSQNALKHGLYSEYYTPEEEKHLDTIKLGDVEEELKLCRIKVRRWLIYQNKIDQEIKDGEDEAGTIIEEVERKTAETVDPDAVQEFFDDKGKPTDPPVAIQEVKRKRKRVNIEDNIDRLVRRIESLERTRHLLMQSEDGHDYEAELRKLLDGDD